MGDIEEMLKSTVLGQMVQWKNHSIMQHTNTGTIPQLMFWKTYYGSVMVAWDDDASVSMCVLGVECNAHDSWSFDCCNAGAHLQGIAI